MWECSKCKEYRFSTAAECHCKSFAIIDENDEEHSVRAMDEKGAALKYAESANVDGDHYLMDESVEIRVNGKLFLISAEPDVHYSAAEL